jgi:hypothetical protein
MCCRIIRCYRFVRLYPTYAVKWLLIMGKERPKHVEFTNFRPLGLAVFLADRRDKRQCCVFQTAVRSYVLVSLAGLTNRNTIILDWEEQVSAGAPASLTKALRNSLQPILPNTRDLSPDITVKCSALQLRILEVLFSNLGFHNWGISCLTFAPQNTN